MKMIDDVINKLKSKTILEKKPNLKLCSNHFKTKFTYGRYWNSNVKGQAISDGKKWYK